MATERKQAKRRGGKKRKPATTGRTVLQHLQDIAGRDEVEKRPCFLLGGSQEYLHGLHDC